MSVRQPMLTPDHPAPGAPAHRQAGYPHSPAGTTAPDHHPPVAGVVISLAAYGGLATGLLSGGDISAKLIGYGRLWLAALTALIVTDAAGTSVLQSAYQRGDVLTASGTATIMTNAVPITGPGGAAG
jgi:hypothetical protein